MESSESGSVEGGESTSTASSGSSTSSGEPTTSNGSVSASTGDPSTGDPSTGDPSTGDPSTGDPSTGESGDPVTCTMNSWIDLTGLGHAGTLENFTNPMTWVGDGSPGDPYALAFDGIDDIVRVAPAAGELQRGDDFTVDLWVRPEANASYYETLFVEGTPGQYAGYDLSLAHQDGYVPNPNSWAWYSCPTGACPYWADVYSDTSAAISTQWYHVVGTYSTSVGFARLYVNGVQQQDSHPVAAPIAYAAGTAASVGNNDNGLNAGFEGRIAIVRVWAAALSDDEVLDLYRMDAGRFDLNEPPPQAPVQQDLVLHYEAGPCS